MPTLGVEIAIVEEVERAARVEDEDAAIVAGNDIARHAHVINLPDPSTVPTVLAKVLPKIHLAAALIANCPNPLCLAE